MTAIAEILVINREKNERRHIKHTKYVSIMEGKEIKVEFDRPTPLQIDGDTVLGAASYTVSAW